MARTFDRKHEGTSEFGGARGPTGISLKPADALSASEQLRLGYLIGRNDPEAEIDPRVFEGLDPRKWAQLAKRFPPPNP